MKKSRFVIVGLGAIGKELLKKIHKDYGVLCIDIDPGAEEEGLKVRGDIEFVSGDATSRLVLEKADVEKADCVILTTSKEEVNVEVARVLREHFQVNRLISIGLSSMNTDTLADLGVEVENIFSASAIGIRNRLEHKSRAAHAIGLGKNEILEVEVHPNSRLANKPVGVLAPIRWRLGIIYRSENIIIPRKNTILKPHDKVVILGEPAVLKTVSDILTFNFEQFPLEYGTTAITYITGREDEAFYNELDYVLSAFPLKQISFLISKKASRRAGEISELMNKDNMRNKEVEYTTLGPLEAIERKSEDLKSDEGMVVLPGKTLLDTTFPLLTNFRKRSLIYALSRNVFCPILIARGTFPYEEMVVPSGEGLKLHNVLETSLEISSSLHNAVTSLIVKPLKYISSEEDLEEFDRMKKTVSEISLMYKTSVKTEMREGNPVRVVTESAQGFNLMLIDTDGWRVQRYLSFLSPDIIWHIVRQSPVSTLLIPPIEEAL